MSQTEHPALPRRAVDENGRILPISPEERRARFEALSRAFDRLEEMDDPTDDDDEGWKDVYRSIDEGRPHRKLFEGMY